MFCYAFATMKGNEQFGQSVIRKLQESYPSWKMNVKFDDKRKFQNNRPYQPSQYPPAQHPFPPFNHHPMHRQFNPYPPNNNHPESLPSEKILGEKPCNILVRELWLGGIPENYDKNALSHVMSYYGIIEEIEIFPKFAFIKYKQVQEATTAFERADEISNHLGTPQGFRIFFSDPARRAYIVSNHYEFEKQSPILPILFVGFPPITSAQVEMEVIKPVCEKYGTIVKEYMRKNSNSQNRSYFLFTFDSTKNVIRAKQELNKRKDLLGDKRTEVSILLD